MSGESERLVLCRVCGGARVGGSAGGGAGGPSGPDPPGQWLTVGLPSLPAGDVSKAIKPPPGVRMNEK